MYSKLLITAAALLLASGNALILPNGGWGLVSNGSCPGGTSQVNNANLNICCPTAELEPSTNGAGAHVCCPRGTSCLASLQATPYCAKTDWVLWNSTTQSSGNGYFCCQFGETGTNDMTCDEKPAPSGSAANRLGRPLPTGYHSTVVKTTISGTATVETIATSGGAAAATSGATTTTATTSAATQSSSGASPSAGVGLLGSAMLNLGAAGMGLLMLIFAVAL